MKKYVVQKIVNGIPHDSSNKYLVVNVDEPYAEKVFNLIRDHEKAKGCWDDVDDFDSFVGSL